MNLPYATGLVPGTGEYIEVCRWYPCDGKQLFDCLQKHHLAPMHPEDVIALFTMKAGVLACLQHAKVAHMDCKEENALYTVYQVTGAENAAALGVPEGTRLLFTAFIDFDLAHRHGDWVHHHTGTEGYRAADTLQLPPRTGAVVASHITDQYVVFGVMLERFMAAAVPADANGYSAEEQRMKHKVSEIVAKFKDLDNTKEWPSMELLLKDFLKLLSLTPVGQAYRQWMSHPQFPGQQSAAWVETADR